MFNSKKTFDSKQIHVRSLSFPPIYILFSALPSSGEETVDCLVASLEYLPHPPQAPHNILNG